MEFNQLTQKIKQQTHSLSARNLEEVEKIENFWKDYVAKIDHQTKGNTKEWYTFKLGLSEELKNKGNTLLKEEREVPAVLYFSLAIIFQPENYVYYSNRSAAFIPLQEYRKALDDANTVVKLNPKWSKGYSRKGLALFCLNKFDEALEAYEKGLELDPSSDILKEGKATMKKKVQAQNFNENGEEASAKGRPQDAINYFTMAIERDPDNFLYWTNRSKSFKEIGEFEKALDDADKTIQIRPRWAPGYSRKGDLLFSLGKYDQAVALYSEGLKYAPQDQYLMSQSQKAMQESILSKQKISYKQASNKHSKKDEKKKGWFDSFF